MFLRRSFFIEMFRARMVTCLEQRAEFKASRARRPFSWSIPALIESEPKLLFS